MNTLSPLLEFEATGHEVMNIANLKQNAYEYLSGTLHNKKFCCKCGRTN